MEKNRWELAAERLEAEKAAANDQRWPVWLTPFRTSLLVTPPLVGLLLLAFLNYQHDAPLRWPHLPHTSALVTGVRSANNTTWDLDIVYRLPDRKKIEEVLPYKGYRPKVNSHVEIAYVPADPSHIRIASSTWTPTLINLCALAGIWALLSLILLALSVKSWQQRR